MRYGVLGLDVGAVDGQRAQIAGGREDPEVEREGDLLLRLQVAEVGGDVVPRQFTHHRIHGVRHRVAACEEEAFGGISIGDLYRGQGGGAGVADGDSERDVLADAGHTPGRLDQLFDHLHVGPEERDRRAGELGGVAGGVGGGGREAAVRGRGGEGHRPRAIGQRGAGAEVLPALPPIVREDLYGAAGARRTTRQCGRTAGFGHREVRERRRR